MPKKVVFMFPGQGSQYYQMGRELFNALPRFKAWMSFCDDIYSQYTGSSFIEELYSSERLKSEPFDNLIYTNAALLSIEYSLARVLMENGIKPDFLLGYSLGELTAAVIANSITIEDGLRLAVDYAEVIRTSQQNGGMLAIFDSLEIMRTHQVAFSTVRLSSINFDRGFVIAGDDQAVVKLQHYLSERAIICQKLPVNCAFHTEFMEPLRSAFLTTLGKTHFQAPTIPIVSALTASQVEQIDDEHLWQVVREPVNFAGAVRHLLREQDCQFIDVGPSGTLATFVKYMLPPNSASNFIETLNQYGKDIKTFEKLKSHFTNDAMLTA